MSINGIGRPRNWNLTDETDDPNYRPNMRAGIRWRVDAEAASENMLFAMRREFLKLAGKHGITVNDATLLLMNGVCPR